MAHPASYHILERDEVDADEWETLLTADTRALPFHRPTWLRRLGRHLPNQRPVWWEVRDEARQLVAGLPLARTQRWGLAAITSGVGGSYGGPVCRPAHSAAEARLIERFAREGGSRVLRRELVWGHVEPPAGEPKWMSAIDTAVLPLGNGFEEFWMNVFPMNRRNECNRSERRGMTIEVTQDPREVEGFYALYLERCADWGSKPLPLGWLMSIVAEEPSCRVVVPKWEGRSLGMHICFELPDELFAWVGTTERSREVFPASMIIKGEAEYAVTRGLSRVNLGSALGMTGVQHFKRLAGAQMDRRWLLLRESALLRLRPGRR